MSIIRNIIGLENVIYKGARVGTAYLAPLPASGGGGGDLNNHLNYFKVVLSQNCHLFVKPIQGHHSSYNIICVKSKSKTSIEAVQGIF